MIKSKLVNETFFCIKSNWIKSSFYTVDKIHFIEILKPYLVKFSFFL